MNRLLIISIFLLSISNVFAAGSWLSLNGVFNYYTQNEPYEFSEYPDATRVGHNSYGPELSLFISFRRGGHLGVMGKYGLRNPFYAFYSTPDKDVSIKYDGAIGDLLSTTFFLGPGYQFDLNDKTNLTISAGFLASGLVSDSFQATPTGYLLDISSNFHFSNHFFAQVGSSIAFYNQFTEIRTINGSEEIESNKEVFGMSVAPYIGIGVAWGKSDGRSSSSVLEPFFPFPQTAPIIDYDSIPIGEMNYRDIRKGKGDIGIKVCESDYQDKGYGIRFIEMLMKELFTMGYSEIHIDPNKRNVRRQHCSGFFQRFCRKVS